MSHEPSSAVGAPTPDPEPGWVTFSAPFIEQGPTFVSGDPSGDRIRVRYYQRESDKAFMGKVWFGVGAEGPPGNAHGGSVAAVLDEAMGYAGWIRDIPVVAAKITVEFRHMMPLHTWVTLEAWVESQTGRKLKIRARLLRPDGVAFAESEGLFIHLAHDTFEELREQREQEPG